MKTKLAVLLLLATGCSHAATKRISIGLLGAEANGGSSVQDITPDGRFVVFTSFASNLVPDDLNGFEDVFVYDRDDDSIERVSMPTAAAEANGASSQATISDDGRYVCFTSSAANLVVGDENGVGDVFVRDRQSATTFRVSVGTGGEEGNGASTQGKISGNGAFVAFETLASNLAAGDGNGVKDIYVRSIAGETTYRVSVANDGGELDAESASASISGDGNVIVFQTSAAIAGGDTNFSDDVYLRNFAAGTTTRVSVGPSGQQASGFSNFPDVSGDGNLVVFASRSTTFGLATERTRIYVKNASTGALEHVSLSASGFDGSGNSNGPTISADGRFVAFSSLAPDLVGGDSNGNDDLFVRDRTAGTTTRVSVTSTGAQSSGGSFFYFATPFHVANDGTVAFRSPASDLVPGDANGFSDVFAGEVDATAPPVVPPAATPPKKVKNTALIAKYRAQIKRLNKQIKVAKKKNPALVKKLRARLNAVRKKLRSVL